VANLSDQTRKEQVHEYLKARSGQWVDGTELANGEVGGSEGLKRVRELRADLAASGVSIIMRRHPDPARDIFQYQLIEPPPPEKAVSPKRKPQVDDANRYLELPKGLSFGEARICDRCRSQTKRISTYATGPIALFRDPDDGKIVCAGCNGWGIVPSVPVAR
jgi:hypothetical protein